MFTQLKTYAMAGVGLLIAALAGLAGYFKLRVAQKEKEISDIKKDSLQESMEQLQDAQEAKHEAGVKANEQARKDIESARSGSRSHFE